MAFICKHFDGESYCYHKDEETTRHYCEHECETSSKVSDYFGDYTEKEKEIYKNMESLNDEDGGNMGCYVRGHYDIETFKKIAQHWMWFEHDKYIDITQDWFVVRQGYFKATPTGESGKMVWVFKKEKMKGSIPVMELEI